MERVVLPHKKGQGICLRRKGKKLDIVVESTNLDYKDNRDLHAGIVVFENGKRRYIELNGLNARIITHDISVGVRRVNDNAELFCIYHNSYLVEGPKKF